MTAASSIAKDVAQVLNRLGEEPLTAEHRALLLDCERQLEGVVSPNLGAPPCPHCGMVQLSANSAGEHIPCCERHPSRVLYQRCSRLARRLTGTAELEPAPALCFPTQSREHDYLPREPLERLLDRLAEPFADEPDRRRFITAVQLKLRPRLNVIDRVIDPCPWCAQVFPLETFREHLWTCERHPGLLRAAVLSDAVKARFGEEAVASALEEVRLLEAREMLADLVRACRDYAASAGYAGGGKNYTKVWSEKPWRFALYLAEDLAREEAKVPMGPSLAEIVSRIATLVGHSHRFWNAMGDDGDRSTFFPDEMRAWEDLVAAAQAP